MGVYRPNLIHANLREILTASRILLSSSLSADCGVGVGEEEMREEEVGEGTGCDGVGRIWTEVAGASKQLKFNGILTVLAMRLVTIRPSL